MLEGMGDMKWTEMAAWRKNAALAHSFVGTLTKQGAEGPAGKWKDQCKSYTKESKQFCFRIKE